MTDQELMEKVKAIRDKTGKYTWFAIEGDAFISDENSISYEYGVKNKDNSYTRESFPTREALVAHMDRILNNLRPKEETTR